ncbi:MAG: Gfo/Idh/MocA family protein [bacterium]
MERRFKYGLVGCGAIARGHMRAYSHLFDLVACCDIYEPAAKEFQETFGFKRAYTDFREFFEKEDLDLVTVCTSSTHDRLDIVLKGAETGTNMLVEKPMALTREEAVEMVEACDRAGVKLAVSQQYRNFPHIRAAYDLIRSGRLGRPFLGELRMAHLTWFPLKGAKRSDYFVKFDKVLILNMTVHHFDMLRFLLGEEPKRIYTRAGLAPFRQAIGERGDTWSASTIDFPSCTFQVFNSADCKGGKPQWEGWAHIECERGTIYLNPDGSTPIAAYSEDMKSWITPEMPPREKFGEIAWQVTIGQFLEWMEGGPEHPTSGRDNLKTLEIVFSAYDSSERGEPVEIKSWDGGAR